MIRGGGQSLRYKGVFGDFTGIARGYHFFKVRGSFFIMFGAPFFWFGRRMGGPSLFGSPSGPPPLRKIIFRDYGRTVVFQPPKPAGATSFPCALLGTLGWIDRFESCARTRSVHHPPDPYISIPTTNPHRGGRWSLEDSPLIESSPTISNVRQILPACWEEQLQGSAVAPLCPGCTACVSEGPTRISRRATTSSACVSSSFASSSPTRSSPSNA